MARIKGGLNAKKKHNRVLKLAKGYRGARSKQYRVAKQSVMRALTSAYAGRKEKKRQFRQLWIARINAAARLNGLSYSKLMYGLKLAEVDINRKMLAELAAKENMTILISSHILKELSALCTDYAIVREGTLIEELSAEELLAKTRSYVVMATNDINRTTAVMEEKLGIHEYKVTYDNEILIYERLDEIETLSKTVTDSGLIITRLNPEGESLEEYYIGKVGGDNE